jgi:hypothetical protein
MEVIVPKTTQQYWLSNETTGGTYTLGARTSTQAAALPITRGGRGIYYCNGTELVKADTQGISSPLSVAEGGTGATTAGAALINLGGTSTGIAVFNAASQAAAQAAIGTVAVAYGGTSYASYTTGDILYASGSGALSKLPIGSSAQVLTVAGGIPSWAAAASSGVTTISFASTGLTPSTATSGAVTVGGTLGAGNGGTGLASYTAGDIVYASGASTLVKLPIGSSAQVLTVTAGVPSWATPSTGVSTISFASTGLTPSTATSGAITVGGTLAAGNGGTGVATLTGMVKGNGTSAFSAATAGTDYVAPGTATTFTAKQTFNGSTSVGASKFVNALEAVTISATAATGTIALDASTQSVTYYTTNASANWTVNHRWSSGTTMNTALATGECVTVTFWVTQGGTAYYNNVVQVDGTTSGVTTKWLSAAPTAGNINSIDVYTYVITKTGASTFTVLASQSKFA